MSAVYNARADEYRRAFEKADAERAEREAAAQEDENVTGGKVYTEKQAPDTKGPAPQPTTQGKSKGKKS